MTDVIVGVNLEIRDLFKEKAVVTFSNCGCSKTHSDGEIPNYCPNCGDQLLSPQVSYEATIPALSGMETRYEKEWGMIGPTFQKNVRKRVEEHLNQKFEDGKIEVLDTGRRTLLGERVHDLSPDSADDMFCLGVDPISEATHRVSRVANELGLEEAPKIWGPF
jgi:hypothetical protein